MTATGSRALNSLGYRPTRAGEVALSGPAARLFDGWSRFLPALLRPYYDDTWQAPLFIGRQELETSRYLSHFPHQLWGATPPEHTAAAGPYLTPAACLHLYLALRGQLGQEGASALITARCARFEDGVWEAPFRLSGFTMTELVVVGGAETVKAKRVEVEQAVARAFRDLGLPGGFRPATDAFFMGDNEGARIIQKLKESKREFAAPSACGDVALASLNHHEEHFGNCFRITLPDGLPASSFCAAFGLERLTAFGLLLWGDDSGSWPRELRP